ncbi:ABC transporter substrate-binding protein [Salinibacterium sp. NG253]|uniref:ABC transporter substrate-binding protein n=1 Tax=Salinibacterium sp. NG253 TaxID=2792039 RepID=UPI0018CDB280|nr:ABC transporter substrate-binding protein [Salinibacterium sp. NG253]MBH0117486.1 ABC transporter substrate-binding protein [Salinibacterium sp. NG253]
MRSFTRRKSLAITATAMVASLALVGCSAADDSSDAAASTELVVGLLASPASLDYSTTGGAAIPQALLYNVYEGLVKIDNAGDIQPLLAESYTVSDDGLVYTFLLHEGVTFSNGSPFTAESVKFSLERVADNWTANGPSYLDPISSVDVVSDTEVTITLSAPSNSWLFNMAGPVGTMFSPDGIDDLATDPVGTGPYDVSEFTSGTSLELTERDDYWGEAPFMSDVTFNYYADATAQTNALLGGDIDLISALTAYQLIGQFESDDDFAVYEGTSTGETTMTLNNQSDAFSDVRVRQAVMYAVDRQAVLDTVNSGYGSLIGSMVPPTDPWFDDSLVDLYPYDPAKAEALLAEAGVSDLTVSMKLPNLPYAVDAGQVVKDQLSQVGITADVTTLEFPAVWLDEVFTNHDYDISIIAHTEPRDISAFAAPTYYAGYDNPEVMALFAEADASDEATFVELMKEASATMAEEAAADWLFLNPNVTAADADLTGVPLNAPTLSFDLTTIAR